MTDLLAIERGSKPDGDFVSFGNVDPKSDLRLRVPRAFQRIVTYSDLQLRLTLDCEFSGERIEIDKMLVESAGKYIASRELTQLRLPHVIRTLALEVIPQAQEWTIETRHEKDKTWESLKHSVSDGFLAQMYWFEHVSWGAPRASLMSYMGYSRTTANAHIKKIAKEFTLPGIHKNPQ
jgi:hypothetical protein